MSLTLADVIEGLTGNRIAAQQAVENVVIDSRQARAGSLFVALPGQKYDGHQFVGQAFQQGAMAADCPAAGGKARRGRSSNGGGSGSGCRG